MSSSKKKEKRPHPSSKDANNSFVSNVTSRVTGLLPASITNWFSSPSSSSANGSAPVADSDSSGDEAPPPASPSSQPPTKRMRFGPPTYNHYDVTEPNCVSTIETMETRRTSSMVQSPPGRNTFRWETNFESTPLRPTEAGERSDKDNVTPKSPSTQHNVAMGSSVAVKRKSLFDIPNSDATLKACARTAYNTTRDPKDPYFKPRLLLGSPFYPGRTSYGGAYNSFVNQPNIRQRKDRVVNTLNTSTEDNSISQSARRIMDLLENYSSPLNDSRRIPHYTRPSIRSMSNASLNSSSQSTSKTISYKTQELHVPSIASILRLKERSRLMDSTTAARQIIASHSSTSDFQPYPNLSNNNRDTPEKETSNKLTTKVKSRLTRPKRGEQNDETELPAPVNLPTAVLQIDQFKLPKFSLDTPKSHPFPTARPPVTTAQTRLAASSSANTKTKSDTVTSANSFQFSSPLRIATEDSAPAVVPSGFTFGSPERTVDPPYDSGKKESHSFMIASPKPVQSKETTDKPKDWKCSDCWVSNKPETDVCVCCGGKRPAVKSSKSDVVKVNSLSDPPAKNADGAWKCGDCWVSNDAGAAQCVCCGGKRPNAPATPAAPAKPVTLNHVSDQWKCPDCWIQNKNDSTQCVACGASRPGVKAQTAVTGSLKIIAKAQTDKWECPNCLVRVDSDKTKCVCCEAEKPGLSTAAGKTTFNFGTTATTAFKFGIPNTQATTTSQPLENKVTLESKSKSEESETNNNEVAKVPTLKFGVPSNKIEDQTDSVKKSDSLTNTTPKINFSFGIPKSSAPTTTFAESAVITSTPAATTTTPVVKFGIPNKLDSSPSTNEVAKEKEKKENPQEVPQVTFTLPKPQETPKPFANFFAPPVSKAAQEKPTSEVAPLNTSANVEKDSSGAAATSIAATSAPAAAPTPTFSFGTATAGGLFAAPKVSAAAPFAAPAATTAAAMPFFQKPELTTTTTSSIPSFSSTNTITSTPMFQKSDASAAITTPLFSFGSNSTTAATKTEAPKFNFSFGSNNKTENSLFNTTPNTAANNTSTNTFTLPNLFGSGNSLTNSLGGGGINGMPSAAPGEPATTSNTLSSGGGLFGSTVPKDMWSATSNAAASPFATTATSSTPQKPPAFSFGASTPFNAGAAPQFGVNTQLTPAFGAAPQSSPAFGAAAQASSAFGAATQATPAFGAPTSSAFGVAPQSTPAFGVASTPAFGASSTPAFGASGQTNAFGGSQQPSTNMFGIGGQNSGNQASPFGSGAGGAAAPSLFGSAVGAQSGGIFGSSAAAAPTFGTPNPSQPPFEAPSLTPAPAPAFNFTPQASGVFGFGQQQQPQGAGVYAFGAGGAGGGGGVQFNMGSGAGAQPGPRRVIRKAVRRTNARQ